MAQWPGLWTKGSLVRFPVRAHAWVAGQVLGWGHVRGNHTLMFLLPFPSKNFFKGFYMTHWVCSRKTTWCRGITLTSSAGKGMGNRWNECGSTSAATGPGRWLCGGSLHSSLYLCEYLKFPLTKKHPKKLLIPHTPGFINNHIRNWENEGRGGGESQNSNLLWIRYVFP